MRQQRRRRLLSAFAAVTAMAIPMVMTVGSTSPASARPAKGAASAAKRGKKIAAAAQNQVPVPRPRPATAQRVASLSGLGPVAGASAPTRSPGPAAAALVPAPVPDTNTPVPDTTAPAIPDAGAMKRALSLIHRGKADEAAGIEAEVRDPVAKKLIEWAILRSDSTNAGFNRYMAFIAANPGWPIGVLRRRAEVALWDDKLDAETVRAFFAAVRPTTTKGRFALARALLAQGARAEAQAFARAAWRSDQFSQDLESQGLDAFGDLLTRADHRARMDRRLYAGDIGAAMRTAHRLGATEMAIAKAHAAVHAKSANAGSLLDAVPEEGRRDPSYVFSRIQWLRRNDRIAEAARLMLAAPRDPAVLQDLDEWWVERRLIARKLLDLGDPATAYQVARDAVPPPKENYRGEHQFTAGWIALRFLGEPATAMVHFARIGQGISNPITLARASYWQGRAAEAMGRTHEARAHYQRAAGHPTAYYGQIARAQLGYGDIGLRPPPQPIASHHTTVAGHEVVRAVEMLYALGERDLVFPFVVDLAGNGADLGALAGVGEATARHGDARATLLIGKTALARGLPFEQYAFPDIGVPHFTAVGPDIERCVVYSIVRQESAFNPHDVSTANALGLMQVTPAAGEYVAKKFNVRFDRKRLMSDTVYNTQLGAAELGDLLKDYRGSYILAFAGYNAGRGRVREWVERYGDPRDPNVDPIDWVERIPFSETRNYVQRVMENLQVYRVRFGQGTRLLIGADLRRGAI
jgi:soluble lytic murein transglycosylase